MEYLNTGVYKITCKTTGKVYIGSTSRNFKERLNSHLSNLKKNSHKNSYLQNAFNKYGNDNFTFEVIEKVKDKKIILEREQYWMDYYDCINPEKGFNINPFSTGGNQFSKEVTQRRGKTFKKTSNDALQYYYKIKENLITIEDVPEKYKKIVVSKLNQKVWNKGLSKKEISYDHLKGVKKTITDKFKDARKKVADINREKRTPRINVYKDNLFLGNFRSAKDIEEFSLTSSNTWPLELRNKKGRNGLNPNILKAQNILNCCKGITACYKGLVFKFER